MTVLHYGTLLVPTLYLFLACAAPPDAAQRDLESTAMAQCTGYVSVKKMGGRTIDVPIDEATTVADVKADVERELEVAVAQQKLLLKGKPLLDAKPVSDYGIADGSTLTLVVLKKKKKKGGGSKPQDGDALKRSQTATGAPSAVGTAPRPADGGFGRGSSAPAVDAQSAAAAAAAAEQGAAAKACVREAERSLEALGAGPPLEWCDDAGPPPPPTPPHDPLTMALLLCCCARSWAGGLMACAHAGVRARARRSSWLSVWLPSRSSSGAR
jgi:hypothetical protein